MEYDPDEAITTEEEYDDRVTAKVGGNLVAPLGKAVNYCVASVQPVTATLSSGFFDADYESIGSFDEAAGGGTVTKSLDLVQLACSPACRKNDEKARRKNRRDEDEYEYGNRSGEDEDYAAQMRATAATTNETLSGIQNQQDSFFGADEYESIGSYEDVAPLSAPLVVVATNMGVAAVGVVGDDYEFNDDTEALTAALPQQQPLVSHSPTLMPIAEIFEKREHFEEMKQMAYCFTQKCKNKKLAKKQAIADAAAERAVQRLTEPGPVQSTLPGTVDGEHFDDMTPLDFCLTQKCKNKKLAKKQAIADAAAERAVQRQRELDLMQSLPATKTTINSKSHTLVSSLTTTAQQANTDKILCSLSGLTPMATQSTSTGLTAQQQKAAAPISSALTGRTVSLNSGAPVRPDTRVAIKQQQPLSKLVPLRKPSTKLDMQASEPLSAPVVPISATTVSLNAPDLSKRVSLSVPLTKATPLSASPLPKTSNSCTSVKSATPLKTPALIAKPVAPKLSQAVSIKATMHQPIPLSSSNGVLKTKTMARTISVESKKLSPLVPIANKIPLGATTASVISSSSSSSTAPTTGKSLSKLVPIQKTPLSSQFAAQRQKQLQLQQQQSKPIITVSNPVNSATSTTTLGTNATSSTAPRKTYLSAESEPMRPLVPLAVNQVGQSFRNRLGSNLFASATSPFNASLSAALNSGAASTGSSSSNTEVNPFGYQLACGSDWTQCPRKNVGQRFPYLARLWAEYDVAPHVTDRDTALVLVPTEADVDRAREVATRHVNARAWMRAYLALHIIPHVRFEQLQRSVLDAGDGASLVLRSEHQITRGRAQTVLFRNDAGALVIVDEDRGIVIPVTPQPLKQVLVIEGDIYPRLSVEEAMLIQQQQMPLGTNPLKKAAARVYRAATGTTKPTQLRPSLKMELVELDLTAEGAPVSQVWRNRYLNVAAWEAVEARVQLKVYERYNLKTESVQLKHNPPTMLIDLKDRVFSATNAEHTRCRIDLGGDAPKIELDDLLGIQYNTLFTLKMTGLPFVDHHKAVEEVVFDWTDAEELRRYVSAQHPVVLLFHAVSADGSAPPQETDLDYAFVFMEERCADRERTTATGGGESDAIHFLRSNNGLACSYRLTYIMVRTQADEVQLVAAMEEAAAMEEDLLFGLLCDQLASPAPLELTGLHEKNRLDDFISLNGALNVLTALSSVIEADKLTPLGIFGVRRRAARRGAAVGYVAGSNAAANKQQQQQPQQTQSIVNVLYDVNAAYLPLKKKAVTQKAATLWEALKKKVTLDAEKMDTLATVLDKLSLAIYVTKVKNGECDDHCAFDKSKSLVDNAYAVYSHESGDV